MYPHNQFGIGQLIGDRRWTAHFMSIKKMQIRQSHFNWPVPPQTIWWPRSWICDWRFYHAIIGATSEAIFL